MDILQAYAGQYGISKVTEIVVGGSTSQESIHKGVKALGKKCVADDTVIIHDGIRPLVDATVLSDVVVKCAQYGNAVSSLPYNEQIFLLADEFSTSQYIPRETLRRVVTPQAYKFGSLQDAYQRAFASGIGLQASAYTNTMMVDLGETLYFAVGSEKNIKLTTMEDIDIFKAILNTEKWSK
jgi:2-C-methyl-D-erythritol 4-phosphate cytidylyltransferase